MAGTTSESRSRGIVGDTAVTNAEARELRQLRDDNVKLKRCYGCLISADGADEC